VDIDIGAVKVAKPGLSSRKGGKKVVRNLMEEFKNA